MAQPVCGLGVRVEEEQMGRPPLQPRATPGRRWGLGLGQRAPAASSHPSWGAGAALPGPAASPGLAHGCLAAPWPLGPGTRVWPGHGPGEAEARLQGEARPGTTGTRWGPRGARGQRWGAGRPQAASPHCPPVAGSAVLWQAPCCLPLFPAAVWGRGAELILAGTPWCRP